MHVPIDPMQSEEAQNVLAISDMKAAFSAIPNFMLTSQSKEVEAESRADCESVCQNDPSCKSLSYRARDQRCYLSRKKLNYRTGWSLHLKETKMADTGAMETTGKYNKFDSLMFRDKNFPRSRSDQKTCQSRCDADPDCGSYSYNVARQLCLLGSSDVVYDPEFQYYEKNPSLKDMAASMSSSKEPRPEEEATEEQEEESKEPHFTPPDDSALNARLAKTAARVAEVDKELKKGNLPLNPKKEKERKEDIKQRERHQRKNAASRREAAQEVFQLENQVSKIQRLLVNTRRSAPAMIKAVAKDAFASGYEKAERLGKATFEHEKQALIKEGEEAFQKSGRSGLGADAKLKKEARERAAKLQSLEENKKQGRMKELAVKQEAHARAVEFSKRASELIADEAQSKKSVADSAELSKKAEEKAASQELAEKSGERGQKKVMLVKSNEKQAKDQEEFQLQNAQDNAAQLEAEIVLTKKEKAHKAKLKEENEVRQKKIEETSSAAERSKKDEDKAAAKERAQKAREAYAQKTALELKLKNVMLSSNQTSAN